MKHNGKVASCWVVLRENRLAVYKDADERQLVTALDEASEHEMHLKEGWARINRVSQQ